MCGGGRRFPCSTCAWPVLPCLPARLSRCQVLILSPTRELAQQTEKVILAVGDFMNVQAHACVGGKSIGKPLSWSQWGWRAGPGMSYG